MIAGVLGAVLSFVVGIWVFRIDDHDTRIRELEVWQAAMRCYISPEVCKEMLTK